MGVIIISVSSVLILIGTIMLILTREYNAKQMLNKALNKNLGYGDLEIIFDGTNYKMSKYAYNKLRLTISIIVLAIGIITLSKVFIIFGLIIYLALYPKNEYKGVKLPFNLIEKLVTKRDRQVKDDELLEVISLLKNMMVQFRNNPKGADYIIEFITENTNKTRPAFLKFLNLMRLGKIKEAEESFVSEIKTPLAMETARILVQIDSVTLDILEQNLFSIQNGIKEIGNTAKQNRGELLSDLLLIPIIATVIIEFLDFLLVAYIGELAQLSYILNGM